MYYRYREYEPVGWSSLKIGDEISEVEHTAGWTLYSYKVDSVNSFQTILVGSRNNDSRRDIFDSETSTFYRRLTDKEIKSKYGNAAKEIYQALKTPISEYEAGEHSMNNSWLGDCFEMAMNQKKYNFKVIGVIDLSSPKHGFFDTYDKGIVIEYANGEKIWCHSNTKFINIILETYEYDMGL